MLETKVQMKVIAKKLPEKLVPLENFILVFLDINWLNSFLI
jgi:hypothetical protein